MVEQQFGCFGADPLGGYDGVRLFTSYFADKEWTIYLLFLFNGFTAFALNVSNFEATKSTSPLVINIAGNIKQVCMIIISVIVFKQPLSVKSVIGCIVTIAGSFWYSIGLITYSP